MVVRGWNNRGRQSYHVGRDGRPRLCTAASPSSCPLGGRHYGTFDEAERAAERQARREHDRSGYSTSLRKNAHPNDHNQTHNNPPLGAAQQRSQYDEGIVEYNGEMDFHLLTNHMDNARRQRFNVGYDLCMREDAHMLRGFEWDRGHKDGPEIHWVMSNGVIIIVNKHTQRFITILIGRPAQVNRYYQAIGERAPRETLLIAREHEQLNYNQR